MLEHQRKSTIVTDGNCHGMIWIFGDWCSATDEVTVVVEESCCDIGAVIFSHVTLGG